MEVGIYAADSFIKCYLIKILLSIFVWSHFVVFVIYYYYYYYYYWLYNTELREEWSEKRS